jgi:hypothetical protein
MTEAEWLACDEPTPMLEFLQSTASDRKLRLFACACCRRLWPLLSDERSRGALVVSELYADGLVSPEELDTACRQAGVASGALLRGSESTSTAATAAEIAVETEARYVVENATLIAADAAAHAIAENVKPDDYDAEWRAARNAEVIEQSHLLRDLFAPFVPRLVPDRIWRTDTAVSLACQMYESRDFSAMPILADALQDAGCDSTAILDHCRGPGPHVRGCFVVDLLLGKE